MTTALDFDDIYTVASRFSLLPYVVIDGSSISLAPPCPYKEGEAAWRLHLSDESGLILNGEPYDGTMMDLADACRAYRRTEQRMATAYNLRHLGLSQGMGRR